jgi:hypothetical protein
VYTVPGSLDKKRENMVPSFIKQRWKIDGIFLPHFLSNEPGTGHRQLLRYDNERPELIFSAIRNLVFKNN